ncbi:hypothetical protein BG011_008199 [Mortierella polycephala]|uniref:Mid2 domain-containing protein n=1 Tax=Mortierella polycephala TaxID=41804 RepID=A0A9P6TXD9_9FUNG|nr:hypothetical protein BG011_008199 [Mortierella polycephala]
MRVDHQSSVLLVLVTAIGTLAQGSSSSPLPLSPPSPTLSSPSIPSSLSAPPFSPAPSSNLQQLQHATTKQPYFHLESRQEFSHKAAAAAAPPQQTAWVDYYTPEGSFVGEVIVTSGNCLTISTSSWGIVSITPMRLKAPTDKDHVELYNDEDCVLVNKEPASQTGLTFIAWYFQRIPRSLRWIRIIAPTTTTASTTTATKTSTTAKTTTTAVTITTSSETPITTATPSQTITPSSTLSENPTSPPTDGAPTPIRTTFPTALLPPKPVAPSNSWDNRCKLNSDSEGGCKTEKHVNRVLIICLSVSAVCVVILGGGAYYIYRNFFMTESIGSSNHKSRSNTARQESGGLGIGYNPDYQYQHDEDDENGGPRFMFDHQLDNINTNTNPKLFQEGSSSTRHLVK